MKVCPRGHYCPLGSDRPISCPRFLHMCDAEALARPVERPLFNGAVALALGGLALLVYLEGRPKQAPASGDGGSGDGGSGGGGGGGGGAASQQRQRQHPPRPSQPKALHAGLPEEAVKRREADEEAGTDAPFPASASALPPAPSSAPALPLPSAELKGRLFGSLAPADPRLDIAFDRLGLVLKGPTRQRVRRLQLAALIMRGASSTTNVHHRSCPPLCHSNHNIARATPPA